MMKKPKLEIDVLTLFPKIFHTFCGESIAKRALAKELIRVNIHDLRTYGEGRHRRCDDVPFGGGPGMVMTPGPIFEAVKAVRGKKKMPLYLMDPHGKPFNQKKARRLAVGKRWMLLCGHYEGIDERVKKELVDEEISLGDFVLTGGEVAALGVMDATIRLVPGVLGNEESLKNESFDHGLLDYPHYTRPQNFQGFQVPDVLLSGNHKKIESWRRRKRLELTHKKRPDLMDK